MFILFLPDNYYKEQSNVNWNLLFKFYWNGIQNWQCNITFLNNPLIHKHIYPGGQVYFSLCCHRINGACSEAKYTQTYEKLKLMISKFLLQWPKLVKTVTQSVTSLVCVSKDAQCIFLAVCIELKPIYMWSALSLRFFKWEIRSFSPIVKFYFI